ncbi:MAG: GTPase HflX [Spirochaetota bacterium]
MIEHQGPAERAYLVGIQSPDESGNAKALLSELRALTETLGLETVGEEMVRVREISPRYFLGGGKAEEIAERARDVEADVLVFDEELSPSQQRNWEQLSGITVTDRQGIILEIFAERAQTREARLQVDLARLEYLLPRLTSAWSHLSRQRGGRRGTRGEGETQLEVDRRMVQQRISSIKRDLKGVQGQRATARRQRTELPMPNGSIVGYTNAGKSSLLRALTGTDVLVANKLFATLDPATRRLELEGGQEVLLTDTVGFIRRLPHGLVEAFKSTLEETLLASFLLHVIDACDPSAIDHARITREVLEEIGSRDKPTIQVLNKTDAVDPAELDLVRLSFPDAIAVSAVTGTGLDELREAIRDVVSTTFARIDVAIPHARYDLAALIHRTGRVLEERHAGASVNISAEVPERTRKLVEEYRSGE